MTTLSDYIERGDVLFVTEEITLVIKTGIYKEDILLFSSEITDLVRDLYFKEFDLLLDYLFYVKSKNEIWMYKLTKTDNSSGMSLHYTTTVSNLSYGKTILIYMPRSFSRVVKNGFNNKRYVSSL